MFKDLEDFGIIRWGLTYTFAVLFDLADYLFFYIAGVPVIGDMFDFIALLVMFPLIGKYTIVNVSEFIPGFDVIPVNTIAAVLAHKEILGAPFKFSLEKGGEV